MKTLTKMTIYTDKCICSDNIWCVSVIRVNTLLFVEVTFVKVHWQILFDKVFAPYKRTHFAKYSLPNFVRGNVALFNITYFLDK